MHQIIVITQTRRVWQMQSLNKVSTEIEKAKKVVCDNMEFLYDLYVTYCITVDIKGYLIMKFNKSNRAYEHMTFFLV